MSDEHMPEAMREAVVFSRPRAWIVTIHSTYLPTRVEIVDFEPRQPVWPERWTVVPLYQELTFKPEVTKV